MTRLAPILVALIALAAPATAATLGANLIVNGDAETGDTTGWVNSQDINAVTGAGQVASGTYAFTAGTGPNPAAMTQEIDLSALAGLIAGGSVDFTVSGAFQNRSSDTVLLDVIFVTASNVFVDSVTLSDPNNSGFAYDAASASGTLGSNVRAALLELRFFRSGGVSSDAYADDLSLVLSAAPIPVPAGLPLLVGGIGALAWMRRRKG